MKNLEKFLQKFEVISKDSFSNILSEEDMMEYTDICEGDKVYHDTDEEYYTVVSCDYENQVFNLLVGESEEEEAEYKELSLCKEDAIPKYNKVWKVKNENVFEFIKDNSYEVSKIGFRIYVDTLNDIFYLGLDKECPEGINEDEFEMHHFEKLSEICLVEA